MKGSTMFTTLSAALIASLALGTSTAHAQGRGGRDQGQRADQGRGDQHDQHDQRGRTVSAEEQKRRMDEQARRDAQYSQRLSAQVQDAQARTAALAAQKRNAQLAAQQQYLQRMQEQQQRVQPRRDYSRDPYITTPPSYRYRLGGTYHETNQYGADVLRDAVNNGYQQGVDAGRADRSDRAPSNYKRAYAYIDGNYGYTNTYVPESDYQYYFRQGFQRGYQDGYSSQSRYGTYSNGTGSILGNILSGILGLQSIP